jgi:hypothetical protein
MEKIKWSEKVINEQVLEHIGEKRTLLNSILRRKFNWIGHILRRNCLLGDVIEGQMTEVKGVGRRRTKLLDDLRNRRRYWDIVHICLWTSECEANSRLEALSLNGLFHLLLLVLLLFFIIINNINIKLLKKE